MKFAERIAECRALMAKVYTPDTLFKDATQMAIDIEFLLTALDECVRTLEYYANALRVAEKGGLGEPNPEMHLMPRLLGTTARETLERLDAMCAEGE